MRAHFGLPSVENDEVEGKPPITVKFEIPYFTVSGIQVCAHVEATLDYMGFESELSKITLRSRVTIADSALQRFTARL